MNRSFVFHRNVGRTDRAIALMQAAGYSARELRVARTMKRAYHRYRAASPFPKRRNVDVPSAVADVPTSVRVRAFPNPFNPSIIVEYTLPEAGDVTLRIHSVGGSEVATIVRGLRPKGVNTAVFEVPAQLPSGTYLYVLETSSGAVTGKIVLAR